MIYLRSRINKTAELKGLKEYVDIAFQNTYEEEYAKKMYLEGAEHMINILQIKSPEAQWLKGK